MWSQCLEGGQCWTDAVHRGWPYPVLEASTEAAGELRSDLCELVHTRVGVRSLLGWVGPGTLSTVRLTEAAAPHLALEDCLPPSLRAALPSVPHPGPEPTTLILSPQHTPNAHHAVR